MAETRPFFLLLFGPGNEATEFSLKPLSNLSPAVTWVSMLMNIIIYYECHYQPHGLGLGTFVWDESHYQPCKDLQQPLLCVKPLLGYGPTASVTTVLMDTIKWLFGGSFAFLLRIHIMN